MTISASSGVSHGFKGAKLNGLAAKTRHLFTAHAARYEKTSSDFPGFSLSQPPELEDLYGVNIAIYELANPWVLAPTLFKLRNGEPRREEEPDDPSMKLRHTVTCRDAWIKYEKRCT